MDNNPPPPTPAQTSTTPTAAATQQDLLASYREQNAEIIRNNARLNERIAILESVIRGLQQDNLQLRMTNAQHSKQQQQKKKTKKKSKPQQQTNTTTRKKENSHAECSVIDKKKRKEAKLKRQGIELNDENKETTGERRACSSKPINYSLPSTRSKLRQGDPFTFGNAEE